MRLLPNIRDTSRGKVLSQSPLFYPTETTGSKRFSGSRPVSKFCLDRALPTSQSSLSWEPKRLELNSRGSNGHWYFYSREQSRMRGKITMSFFFPFFSLLAGLAEPGPCTVMETPKQSKLKVLIHGQCQTGLERDLEISKPVKMVAVAGRQTDSSQVYRSREVERDPSLYNLCMRNHKGHRGNWLRLLPSVPVMVLAMTLSYSIALPKDCQ